MIDHDQLWKTVLKTFFADFLDLVAPELAKHLRLDEARFLEQEHFTRPASGRRVALDLIAEVPARRGPAWLVHVEIERRYRRTVARRMSRYYRHLRLDHRKPVLPIVLYLHGGPAGVEWTEVHDAVGERVVDRFSFLALGLSRCRAASYLERSEPLAWAMAALMRADRIDRAIHKLTCLRSLAKAKLSELQRFLLLEVVETYLVLEGKDTERYNELLTEEPNKEVKAMEMTWSQKLEAKGRERGMAEGRERGMAEGRERGRLDGARVTLIRLLERRFGPLANAALARLAAISEIEAIERLVDRALDARSLDELGLGGKA